MFSLNLLCFSVASCVRRMNRTKSIPRFDSIRSPQVNHEAWHKAISVPGNYIGSGSGPAGQDPCQIPINRNEKVTGLQRLPQVTP